MKLETTFSHYTMVKLHKGLFEASLRLELSANIFRFLDPKTLSNVQDTSPLLRRTVQNLCNCHSTISAARLFFDVFRNGPGRRHGAKAVAAAEDIVTKWLRWMDSIHGRRLPVTTMRRSMHKKLTCVLWYLKSDLKRGTATVTRFQEWLDKYTESLKSVTLTAEERDDNEEWCKYTNLK